MYGGNNFARVSRRSPSAWAICDFCGAQYNRSDLVPDMQYMGTEIRPTGFLVCARTCLDKPQPQQKAIRLPPDPLPVADPRVDNFPNGNFGFTQYNILRTENEPTGGLAGGGIGAFIIGETPIGVGPGGDFVAGGFYYTPASVLAQVAALSGVPTPIVVQGGVLLAQANVSQQFMGLAGSYVIGINGQLVIGIDGTPVVAVAPDPTNPRNWLLLFNPSEMPISVAFGSVAAYGTRTNIILGGGEALFAADAQFGQPTYQGPFAAIVPAAPLPLWAWQSSPQIEALPSI